ncbi:MAG TPA: sulfite exporter TauE/SafE family protein [Acidimicrobiales bacterium]|nr:sulfite exporter TauE/SafE family protein [Acidimicrobiales bacterium]
MGWTLSEAPPLSPSHVIVLLGAGLVAGIFNGIAGGGSLISFPVLLGLGYPALTANITNTVGIWTGYLGSTAGFRREISDQRHHLRRLGPIAVVGGVGGAVLLLTTPSSTFDQVAPWLVLAASLLFGAQPLLRRAFEARSAPETGPAEVAPTAGGRHPTALLFGVFGASVYGGYFGAAMGVMLLAMLGLGLPDSIARTSGLRAILSVLVNGVAAVVFLVHGGLAWGAVGLLALGALGGGWIGARIALAIPAAALRGVVIVIGLGTAVKLLVS